MNYGPDFGDILWMVGLYVYSAGLLLAGLKLDEELYACNGKRLWYVWIIACLMVTGGYWIGEFPKEDGWNIAWLVLAVYLVVCTVMDSLLNKVSDILQYIGLAGGICALISRMPVREIGGSLLLFALIQYFLFRQMYGDADVMAFLVCSLYWAAEGMGMESYLWHMVVCYLLLALVQGIRGNIGRNGDLKTPVALYPYISASFLLIICQ